MSVKKERKKRRKKAKEWGGALRLGINSPDRTARSRETVRYREAVVDLSPAPKAFGPRLPVLNKCALKGRQNVVNACN